MALQIAITLIALTIIAMKIASAVRHCRRGAVATPAQIASSVANMTPKA